MRQAAVAEYHNTITALVDRTVQLAAALSASQARIKELEAKLPKADVTPIKGDAA